jgi:hypothetical protein
VRGHCRLHLTAQAKRVIDDDRAQVIQPAVHRLDPGRRALQAVGGSDVEHQEPVQHLDELLSGQTSRK